MAGTCTRWYATEFPIIPAPAMTTCQRYYILWLTCHNWAAYNEHNEQTHLSMTWEWGLRDWVLMATRPTRLVGNVLPTQEPSPCPTLGCKPLASLLTQAAGGRGQPGQLPHPAALLCREGGTIVSGAKEINSNCITVTVSHNLCCWIKWPSFCFKVF